MRALSIRQPFAEMILSGLKTIEYRTRPTRIIGERFWIYASKGGGTKARRHGGTKGLWSTDLSVPGEGGQGGPPPWMVELANGLKLFPHELPTGLIVGSAVIERCDRWASGLGVPSTFRWHLADVDRLARPMKPARHPQPAWFVPF